MTQFEAPFAAQPGLGNRGITNGREIAAYALAQAFRLAAIYLVSYSGALLPLYTWAFHSGIMVATYGVTVALSLVWGTAGLILFLVLRGPFGGVPTLISAPGREQAITTRGAEIGSFVVAYAISLIAVMALNIAFLAPIYRTLGQDGQRGLVTAISLTVSIVTAIVVFVLFIALRRGFAGPPPSSAA
jgi:riboflavin transporter FmnP